MNKQQALAAFMAASLCVSCLPAALAANAAPLSPSAQAPADQHAQRLEDLRFLMETLERVHPNMYANSTREAFAAKRAEIEAAVDSMSDFDFCVAVSELVALVGDSHTGARISSTVQDAHFLPFDVTDFNGEWVLSALARDQEDLLGGTITAINGVPIEQVQQRLAPMTGADNAVYARRQFGGQVYVYEILSHYGIASDPAEVALSVRLPDGASRTVNMSALTREQMRQLDTVSLSEKRAAAPATAADKSKFYFFKPLDARTLYIQYNTCREDESLSMEDFTAQVQQALDENSYDRAIVDLRNNGGGSDGVVLPLLHLLEERRQRDGLALYTLIGGATFSSALINAVELKQAGAILVGTPTGGSVDHFGAVSSFELPHSGIQIGYSTKFIDLGTLLKAAEPYNVESLPPDISAAQTLEDFLAGRDTAAETILRRLDDTPAVQSQMTRATLAVDLGRRWAQATGENFRLEQPLFSDVSLLSYTAPYVVWAQKNGLMAGDDNALFAPDRTLTREECAAVLYRYAAFRNISLSGTKKHLTDLDAASPWAVQAVQALANADVFPVENGRFSPQAPISRAEFQEILNKLEPAARP